MYSICTNIYWLLSNLDNRRLRIKLFKNWIVFQVVGRLRFTLIGFSPCVFRLRFECSLYRFTEINIFQKFNGIFSSIFSIKFTTICTKFILPFYFFLNQFSLILFNLLDFMGKIYFFIFLRFSNGLVYRLKSFCIFLRILFKYKMFICRSYTITREHW